MNKFTNRVFAVFLSLFVLHTAVQYTQETDRRMEAIQADMRRLEGERDRYRDALQAWEAMPVCSDLEAEESTDNSETDEDSTGPSNGPVCPDNEANGVTERSIQLAHM